MQVAEMGLVSLRGTLKPTFKFSLISSIDAAQQASQNFATAQAATFRARAASPKQKHQREKIKKTYAACKRLRRDRAFEGL
jgi:hypothetical protein